MKHIQPPLYGLLIAAVIAVPHIANADETKPTFDGFYTGLETGASFGQKGRNGNAAQFYLGGVAGYRKQMLSNWVFGLEGAFAKTTSPSAFGDLSNESFADLSLESLARNTPFVIDNKYEWSLATTFGHVLGAQNNGLLYGKVGLAANRRDVWDRFTCPSDEICITVVTFERQEQTHYNLLVGAGYERKIGDGISMRFSLDYIAPTDLNDLNSDETDSIDLFNTKLSLIYQF